MPHANVEDWCHSQVHAGRSGAKVRFSFFLLTISSNHHMLSGETSDDSDEESLHIMELRRCRVIHSHLQGFYTYIDVQLLQIVIICDGDSMVMLRDGVDNTGSLVGNRSCWRGGASRLKWVFIQASLRARRQTSSLPPYVSHTCAQGTEFGMSISAITVSREKRRLLL